MESVKRGTVVVVRPGSKWSSRRGDPVVGVVESAGPKTVILAGASTWRRRFFRDEIEAVLPVDTGEALRQRLRFLDRQLNEACETARERFRQETALAVELAIAEAKDRDAAEA